MPDIFLSYNREDQAAARRFAEAFEAQGFDVWWDTTLRAGEAYDEVTENALNAAKAVVVLWSPRSVVSRWVRAEATQADRNKTLVPVTIEACKRPIMFELTQTAELSHWQGEAADKSWQAFLADVTRFVQTGIPVPASSPPVIPAALARAERLSICVLPFANMSRDEDQEYFADGISEDIITDLSKVSALSVIARNSAFAFKGKAIDVKQVARQLEVSHVLEGSVRKAGNRVRITAQLIVGATNDHLWAERWDRDLDDIFALQDEISQEIVKALKLKLLPEEKKAIEKRDATSLEAYDKYLRARALANSGSASDLPGAAELCRQALEIDPDFAPARGALAVYHSWDTVFRPKAVDQMEETVRQALVRAPDHWASHLATGILMMQRHEWLSAEAAFSKARDLAPPSQSDVDQTTGVFLANVGRNAEAVRLFEAARNADPLEPYLSFLLQASLDRAGRAAEAQVEYERTQGLQGSREMPEHQAVQRLWNSGDMGAIRIQARRYLDNQALTMPVLEQVYEVFDQPAVALDLLGRAFEDSAYQDGPRMYILSWYAAHFGDIPLALAAMRRSFVEMNAYGLQLVWYPCLKEARQTSAFKQFVRDVGLYDYWRKSGQWGDFARPIGDNDFEIMR